MVGNEIDTHATLNEMKNARAYDGGREVVLLGFLTFLGLVVLFMAGAFSWLPTILGALICVVLPLIVAFATWKVMATRQQRRSAQEAERKRQENHERAAQQISEARARGDFDRWNKDK